MMRSSPRILVLAVCAAALVSSPARVAGQHTDLSGEWDMNRDLSTAAGVGMGPQNPGRNGGVRGGRGGGMGRPPGGGFGGAGGGRSGAGAQGGRPSADDMELRRVLMQEVQEFPVRLTIKQSGDQLTLSEPEGVARTYAINNKTEKHQLTSGTIETKTSWDGPSLRMEITIGGRDKIIRTFAVRQEPRRLEVATGFDGASKDARRLVVFDERPH